MCLLCLDNRQRSVFSLRRDVAGRCLYNTRCAAFFLWPVQAFLEYIQIMKTVDSFHLDKSSLTVTSLSDESEEKEYWSLKSPEERLRAIEQMRQIIYGYDPLTSRLQRVFTTAQLSQS